MATPLSVDDLDIVGYANVLKANMLPSVVPPVFCLKADARRAFLPPYSFNAGFLCNATELPQSELVELRNAQRITLFNVSSPARANFDLWVDQSFQPHYEPRDHAKRNLRHIAEDAITGAQQALLQGDLQQAERLSSVAYRPTSGEPSRSP